MHGVHGLLTQTKFGHAHGGTLALALAFGRSFLVAAICDQSARQPPSNIYVRLGVAGSCRRTESATASRSRTP